MNAATESVIEKAYAHLEQLRLAKYKEADCKLVFTVYFSTYKKHMGQEHPNLKQSQIERIIQAMPGDGKNTFNIVDYYRMIQRHFNTKYSIDCDYNINHFFSGNIRTHRFNEIRDRRDLKA